MILRAAFALFASFAVQKPWPDAAIGAIDHPACPD